MGVAKRTKRRGLGIVLMCGLALMSVSSGDGASTSSPAGAVAYIWGPPGTSRACVRVFDLGQVLTRSVACGRLGVWSGELEDDLAWSPDGRYLAFAKAGRSSGVYFVHPDGSGLHRVISSRPTKFVLGQPGLSSSWSPDSTRLVLDRWHEAARQACAQRRPFRLRVTVATVPIPSAIEVPMLSTETRSKTLSNVEWSPTGTRFAYVIESNRVRRSYGTPYCEKTSASLYVASADGRTRRVLVHASSITSIAWSPDERTLAYVGCPKPRRCSIYAVGSDGGNPHRISRRSVERIRWMPSGRELLGSEYVLRTIDVVKGRTRVLVRSDPDPTDCQVAPTLLGVTKDGAWIGAVTREFYVFDDCKDVYKVTVALVPYAGGQTERFSVPPIEERGQIDSVSLYLKDD
jgi:dipeptidyl aminopeptidase/acylaminoacyl peptidase